MEQNNSSGKNFRDIFQKALKKILAFLGRWFFMISLLAAAIFCVFVWYGYVFRADWDETQKQQYISEQAKFSFDKAGYQKMVDMMKTRQDKLQNFPKFAGRDIFFPEGF